MSNRGRRSVEGASDDEGHLEELPDGSGCFEIWDYLSNARSHAADD